MEDRRNVPPNEGRNFSVRHTVSLGDSTENMDVNALGLAPEEPITGLGIPLFTAQREALSEVVQKLEEHASQGNKGKLIIPVVELPKAGAKEMLLAGEERIKEAGGNIRTYKSYNASGADRISGSYYSGPWPIVLHMTTNQLEEFCENSMYRRSYMGLYGEAVSPVFMGTMTPQEMDDYIHTLPNPYGHDLLTIREISMGVPTVAKMLLVKKGFKPEKAIEQYLGAAGVNAFVRDQGIKNHYEGSDLKTFCPSYTQVVENYEIQKEQERAKEDERKKMELTLSSSQREALQQIRELERKLPNGTNVQLIAVVGLSGIGKSYALKAGGVGRVVDSHDHLYKSSVLNKLRYGQSNFHPYDRLVEGSGQKIIALTPRELVTIRERRKDAKRYNIDNIGSINVVPMKGMTLSETIQFLTSQPEAGGKDADEIEKIARYSMGIALLGKQMLLSSEPEELRDRFILTNLGYDPDSKEFKDLASVYLQAPSQDDPAKEVVRINDGTKDTFSDTAHDQESLRASNYPIDLGDFFNGNREEVIEAYEKEVGFPITPPAYTVPQSVEIVEQMIKSPRSADNLYSVYTPTLPRRISNNLEKNLVLTLRKKNFPL